jgi:hypothetical protein
MVIDENIKLIFEQDNNFTPDLITNKSGFVRDQIRSKVDKAGSLKGRFPPIDTQILLQFKIRGKIRSKVDKAGSLGKFCLVFV